MGLRNRVKPSTKEFAKHLRKNPTRSEYLLWKYLRKKRLGAKFRRQAILLGWIIDFWCPKVLLAVEIDGKIHQSKKRKERDILKDKILAKRGILVLRFKSADVFDTEKLSILLSAIKETLEQRKKVI